MRKQKNAQKEWTCRKTRWLDKALEDLIDKLDEAGKLEKTVFIVTPDHYPYGLTDSGYDALAGKNVSDDAFEKHHSCLEFSPYPVSAVR